MSADPDEEKKGNGDDVSQKDSRIIYLAKKQRWDDLKIILRENYRISSESDAIICSTLIEELLDSCTKIDPTKIIDFEEFKKIFNNTFDGLTNDSINQLYAAVNINNGNYNQLLNHKQLPMILLTVYYYTNKVDHSKRSLKEALERLFDKVQESDKKINNVSVRIEAPNKASTFGEVIIQKNKSVNIKYDHNDSDNSQFDDLNQCSELLAKGFVELKNKTKIHIRSKAWLSCDFRIDAIRNKEQNYSISGWVNTIWKEPSYTEFYKVLTEFYHTKVDSKNVWYFNDKITMRILDLREHDRISYYLPIDARRIFDQTSVKSVLHRDPPYLIFNKNTGIIRTEYNITAKLSEHFELFWFPFDKQFLNVKLRWNVDYYHILPWINDKKQINYPVNAIPDIPHTKRYQAMFYNQPLKVNVVEELRDDIILHEPWIGFETKIEDRTPGLRFALIRLRFTRNPLYHATYILFPIFIIVLCGFSVYSIPINEISSRLDVSVTVLLTFTAFQSIIKEELPNTSELAFLDYYILFAFLLQAAIILTVSYPYFYDDEIDLNEDSNDDVFAVSLFIVWMIVSVLYIGGGIMMWSVYKCCRSTRKEFALCDRFFWVGRAKEEQKRWGYVRELKHKFVMRVVNSKQTGSGNDPDNDTDVDYDKQVGDNDDQKDTDDQYYHREKNM